VAWDVLLIGGGGGTGKTTAAAQVAARVGAAFGQVDDFRLVLQRSLPPDVAPGLHFFLDRDVAPHMLADALAAQRAIANFMTHALEPVIAHHVETRLRLVLEGDAILPSLALQSRHAGIATLGRVAAVYLEEPDRAVIAANVRRRDCGFRALRREGKEAMVSLQHGHGAWLCEEARRVGVPVLPSRPWTTLAQRILLAVGEPDPRLA
jgi:2-phosphoglycerate kinase